MIRGGQSIVAVAAIGATALLGAAAARSQPQTHSPIHPVGNTSELQALLARIPPTKAFPPDFSETLSTAASVSMIEMTTSPGCVPCADLWNTLGQFRARYHWQVRTISGQEALIRSGRLGLPWVGHPVAWVRPLNDPDRTIPIAIGTDHFSNIARNAYLATKMLSGVRPAIALRGMARFTGIIGAAHTGRTGPSP